MANLRAGIIPYMSTGAKREVTRLASESIHIHANTWTRYMSATLSKEGRLSIKVEDGYGQGLGNILEVELPANQGQHKDAFPPGIKMSSGMEKGMLESLLKKYFGDDMAKSLLITLGLKGSPLLEDNGEGNTG